MEVIKKDMLLKELAKGLSQLFYPSLCEGCTRALLSTEEVLCLECSMQLPRTGYHDISDNETAVRFAGRLPFINASSFAYFTNEGLLQHLLHRLKYNNRQEIGIYLGREFGKELKACKWGNTIDLIIPVPLHYKKERSRGYNQSLLIARGMSDTLGCQVAADVIMRSRHTESQTQKTRSERIENMRDAFEVKNAGQIAEKHILLVDDVLTTGATLEACSQALMKGGSNMLSIATIGIAS